MQIDFSQTFLDLDGEPVTRPAKDGTLTPVTLGYICGSALMASDPQKPDPPEDKVRCYDVATRVYKGGMQEVSAEDIALLKSKVGIYGTPLIVGPAMRMLEQQ